MEYEDLAAKTLADAAKFQQAIDREVNPRVIRAAREMLDSFKAIELPATPTLSVDVAEILKASRAIQDTLTAMRPLELRPIEISPLRLKPIDIFDARPIGFPDLGDQLIKGLSAPLREFAANIEQQQNAIALALSGLDRDQFAPFRQATELARQHYQQLAESGAFEVERSAVAVVRALEATEPKELPSPDIIEEIVRAVVGLVVGLAQRTKRRAREIDLIEILYIIVMIRAFLPDPTAQEVKKTLEIVDRLEDTIKVAATTKRAEREYVDSLPRSIAVGAGRVREEPSVDARIRFKLTDGTVVAVAGKRGRWRQVVYYDNLAGDLAEGWIWSGSLRDPY